MTTAVALATGEQLSLLAKADKKALLKALSALITQLRQSLNVGKNLDTLQVYECASLLAEKYWYLRLEEFLYVFKQAKLGKYGKIYDRLDVQVISGWLHAYDTGERLVELQRQRQAQPPEADGKLPLEEVHRCYQRLLAGERSDTSATSSEYYQPAETRQEREAEYYKFRLDYCRRRRAEKETTDPAGAAEGSLPKPDRDDLENHDKMPEN